MLLSSLRQQYFDLRSCVCYYIVVQHDYLNHCLFTSQFIAVHLCVDSKTSDTVLSSNAMEANNLTFCCVSGRGDASEDHIRRCTT